MSEEVWTPDDGPKTPLSIFRNTNKKAENHPDYSGEVLVTDTILRHIINLRNDGKMAVMSYAGWKKNTRNGDGYISGSMSVDTYKTAKRYDVERSEIEAIMNQTETTEEVPTGTPAAAAGDDIFDDPPATEDEDPFGI